MSRAISHLRRNWGKYLILSSVSSLTGYFGYKRFCDDRIMRQLSLQAVAFQAERHKVAEPLEKVFVLLNPSANRGKAKKLFHRFAAPIIHLSGSDVTIIELDSEQHLREIVNYLPPSTASVIVAGGSGTLLNTVTALLRRKDKLREWDKVPIGFIPLGYRNGLASVILTQGYALKSEEIARSVITCLQARAKPVDVMELVTEEGKRVYALSELLWGPLVEGTLMANQYSLLGPMRGFFGFLRHAFKFSTNETIYIDRYGKGEEMQISALAVSAKNGTLKLKSWDKIDSKFEFARTGVKQVTYETPADWLGSHSATFHTSVSVTPLRDSSYWFHIDGEEFEPFPVEIRILENKLHFFTDK